MYIIEKEITTSEIEEKDSGFFLDMVKAVVDVEKEIIAVDAELHADLEQFLLGSGSKQENLWGINIYYKQNKDNRIEFDSMINLRPSSNNYTRGIDDKQLQEKIAKIVNNKIVSK